MLFKWVNAKPGMGKLSTWRATFEKNYEAEGRTDWKSKKVYTAQMFCFLLKISEEQKKSCFTVGVYIYVSARGP